MELSLRKIVRFQEDILIEGGRAAARPWKMFAAAAVLKNPWAGAGFVEDLKPVIQAVAPPLGSGEHSRKTLSQRALSRSVLGHRCILLIPSAQINGWRSVFRVCDTIVTIGPLNSSASWPVFYLRHGN